MAVWIVRGGSRLGDSEQDFLESQSVGIFFGASRNLNGRSKAEIRRDIHQFHVDYLEEQGELVEQPSVQRVVTYYLTQVMRFRDEIGLGDTIVMPRKASGGHSVAHGIVESGYEHWRASDYPHRRRVQWIAAEVPRQEIGHVWNPSDQRTVFRIDN